MSVSFWKNKRVIVTGAGGFIGSQLVAYLNRRGAIAIGIAKPGATGPKLKALNILDYDKLAQVFSHKNIYACFHLASESLVERGQEVPYTTFKNTIDSALNVLETCRLCKVQRIIVASSAHVYGNTPIPFKEEDPPRPSRPYETSKTCTDLIAQSYADTFHLPVLIPRFVNIYGPGDLHFTRIIPKTIQQILLGNSPTMWGGNVEREYLYIDDVLRAYDLLAQISDAQIERNRIYNFGTNKMITVRELMDKIIQLCGDTVQIKQISQGRADELPQQKVAWTKARRVLGWQPTVGLSRGLARTIGWYRDYFKMI